CTAPKRLATPRSLSRGSGTATISWWAGGGGSRGQSGLPAGGGEVGGADLVDGVQAVLDDGVRDRLAGDGRRRGQHRRHVADRVVGNPVQRDGGDVPAAGEGDGHGRGGPGRQVEGLVDGHVLLARENPAHGGELGVLAGDGGQAVDVGGLQGGEDAGGQAVVGGVDAVDVVGAEVEQGT